MSTIPTQIRIDENVKKDVNRLFKELGVDLSTAVNIFLRQCIIHGGIPFKVVIPEYNHETIKAINEAKKISMDPDVPGYSNMKDFKAALLED